MDGYKTAASHFINQLLTAINSLPPHVWFTIGVILASVPVVTIAVEAVKRLHLKYNGTEMTNRLINFTVTVTGLLMTLADFVITNGTMTAQLFPFMLPTLLAIKAFAPVVYDESKAIHNWLINRQNEDQKQRLSSTVALAAKLIPETDNITETATLPTRSISFGNAANGKPEPPRIQL